jgi:hypothetical protein
MSNRGSYLSTTKEYRNLERQIALGSKPGAFRRLFGGAKAKIQNLANKMYARKKLAPINYKLSIGWKQHVMGLLRKQQNAQQKVENLKRSWPSVRVSRGNIPNFKSKLNTAERNLEKAKRLVKNARRQKVLTIGSTEYTKKGATPTVSAVPVLNLNNNTQRLVNIARKNPPKLNKILNDEFNRLFPFRPSNNRVEMRKKLASMKGVPWSVQRAATRRSIKIARAAINYNQKQAFEKNKERENTAKAKAKANEQAQIARILANQKANNSNNVYYNAVNNSNNEFREPGNFPINANVAKANEQARILANQKAKAAKTRANEQVQIARILANQNAKQKAKAANAKAKAVAANARLAANNAKLARMVQNASSAAARAKAIARLKGPQPTGILKKAYPLPLIPNNGNAYPLPLIENAANAVARLPTRANLLKGVSASETRANLLKGVSASETRANLLKRVSASETRANLLQPKRKTLRERASARMAQARNAQRNARRREAALGDLPIFPLHNFGGRAIK